MQGKQHIFLLTNSFPYGGAESYLINELEVYEKLNLNLTIIPFNVPRSVTPLEQYRNFKVLNIAFDDYDPTSISLRDKLFLFGIYIQDMASSRNFKYIKENFKFNYSLLLRLFYKARKIENCAGDINEDSILYSYWCNDLSIVGAFLKKRRDIILISRGHGFDILKNQTKYNHLPFKYYQLKLMNGLYSVSKAGEKDLKTNYPDFSTKINCSYLGIKNEEVSPFDSSDFAISTCSYIREIKRLHLMEGVLNKIDFPLTWHVLGDGPDLDSLKNVCRKLPSNIKVVFHGYLSQNELYKFYKDNSVNLFVSLSSSEGLPVSMMEAISFGIPIMSTDVGGCNEICNDVTGFLIPKDFNSEAVANQIRNFRNSEKNSIEFRMGVRKFWNENFNAESNYQKFAKEFQMSANN